MKFISRPREEELEVTGYITSITPRTRRGLLEYRLKVITLGGEPKTIYMREPAIPLRPGLPVKIKAILSKQLEKPRWIAESVDISGGLKVIEPSLTSIDKVTKGRCLIVSGKREGKMFSIPVQEEEIASKIPEDLPQDLYCIFVEHGYEIRLAEILRKKEYEVFAKTLRFLADLNRERSENEKAVKDYLRNVQE